MSIYSVEIKDKDKKLEYYEAVFPRLNDFYEKNYKTVEINKSKANAYDSLVKNMKRKIKVLEIEEDDNYTNNKKTIAILQELLDTQK